MKQSIRKAVILWGGVIASLSVFSQTPALSVDGNGNTLIPYGSSYWVGTSNFWLNRLRMTHDGNEAYIDYYPTLNFRSSLNNVMQLGYYTSKWFSPYGSGQVTLDCSTPWGNHVLYPAYDGDLFIGKENNRVWVQAKQVWAMHFTSTSDERAKENITNLESSIDKLKKLRAVRYDIKKEYAAEEASTQNTKGIAGAKKRLSLRNNNIGLLAQELEKVYPELVTKTDSAGTYGVNYMGLIPVLIHAINEQQTKIEDLQLTAKTSSKLERRIAQLEAQLNKCCAANKADGKLKSASETDATANTTALTSLSTASATTPALLGDNTPNPFNQLTVILLGIPETTQKAQITIYDLTGKQLKAYSIVGRGQTSLTISANELQPGMYKYALLTDGVLVDTKTMVVTE